MEEVNSVPYAELAALLANTPQEQLRAALQRLADRHAPNDNTPGSFAWAHFEHSRGRDVQRRAWGVRYVAAYADWGAAAFVGDDVSATDWRVL